jgi:DNA mismatch repair protein MSH6
MLTKSLLDSPFIQGKKAINYAESDDDDVFHPISSNATGRRASKRRKVSLEDSDDEFGFDATTEDAMLEGGTYHYPTSS